MDPKDLLDPCIPVKAIATQSRIFRDGKGLLLKYSRGGNPQKVQAEAVMLTDLRDSGYVPKVYDVGPNYILMEDLGESEKITDLEKVIRHALATLTALRKASIFHNDLASESNILYRDSAPYIIDFGRATRGKPLSGAYPDYFILIAILKTFLRQSLVTEHLVK